MNTGFYVFASVVLLLLVYHRGFRKVFLWSAGIAAVLATVVYAVILFLAWQEDVQRQKDIGEFNAGVARCVSRFPANTMLQDQFGTLRPVEDVCKAEPDIRPGMKAPR